MTKTYVLDTNVLLADPQCFYKFQENNLIIPIKVLEEVDSFKSEMSERGRNSRTVSRTLDEFRSHGNLFDGIKIIRDGEETGGILKVSIATEDALSLIPKDLARTNDIFILAVAILHKNSTDAPVILVSRDTNLRVIADACGVPAENYKADTVDTKERYTGHQELYVTAEQIDTLYKMRELAANGAGEQLYPNEYVLLKSNTTQQSALVRYDLTFNMFELCTHPDIWGIQGKNAEQKFAIDALLNPDIHLVTLAGRAGTGKTLLAIAAGLHQVTDEPLYKKVLAARPVIAMGKDIGYLPGDKNEKLDPWMQPIYDNVDHLLSVKDDKGKKSKGHKELIEFGILEIEALTYVRGRSIPLQFIIIDEAQNLTPHEVKTIITRAGVGTKIVLTGDPEQIDAPFLDRTNNGLVYVIEKFKDTTIAAHITLEKGERSELATLASDIL